MSSLKIQQIMYGDREVPKGEVKFYFPRLQVLHEAPALTAA